MTDLLEQQAEELEALASIYEGDNFFKQLNNTTFQYKVRFMVLFWFFKIIKFHFFAVWRRN